MVMRKTLFKGSIWIFAGVLVFFSSCNPSPKKDSAIMDDVEASDQNEDLTSFSHIYHLYPSPAEMLGIIDMADVTYNETLLTPPGDHDKYVGSKARTSMLGIYMADLAYTALFGRHEASLDYLEVVRNLAEEIRIDEAVNDEMMEKARNNVEYLDSLYQISNEAFINIITFCERNERSNTVVMLSAGAFIESLYLAVNQIENYEQAGILLQHLADQKFTIDNFMAFAESVTKDEDVKTTIDELKAIKAIYDEINPGSGEVSISTSKDDSGPKKLVIGGADKQSQPSLSQEEFSRLKAEIIALRNKLTNA